MWSVKKWKGQTMPSLKNRESESNIERKKKKTNRKQQGCIDKRRTELKQKKRVNAAMKQESV